MIDRRARDRLADVIDRFIAGEIDAVHHDSEACGISGGRDDRAPDEIYGVLWGTYSDVGSQRIDDLGPEAGAAFRRAAVFLRTDLEYPGPDTRPALKRSLLRVAAGLAAMIAGVHLAVANVSLLGGMAAGVVGLALLVGGRWTSGRAEIDTDVWPFASEEQMRTHLGQSAG